MDPETRERFQENLQEQYENLSGWLAGTPAPERRLHLGPLDEQAVHERLEVIDTALARAMDNTLGLCTVCHDYVETERLEMDYTACVCLEHLSEVERTRLEAELELAAKVQQALLPQQVAAIPGLEVAAFSRPAAIVGGDYFDFFTFRDGAHGLVIGDVAGHGMSASLLMASLQAALRILVADHDTPSAVAERLNGLFYHNIRMTHFVSLFLARVEPETLAFTYCNAGHNPPLLLRRQEGDRPSLMTLPATGAAIGLVEAAVFDMKRVDLVPGDTLLLYTDGVTEALNPQGEEFGLQRLGAVVRMASDWPAQRLVSEVRQQLETFASGVPLADDTTLVACRVNR